MEGRARAFGGGGGCVLQRGRALRRHPRPGPLAQPPCPHSPPQSAAAAGENAARLAAEADAAVADVEQTVAAKKQAVVDALLAHVTRVPL